jgi:hypothetical protein
MEPLLHPVHNRNQGFDIGGVSRPEFREHRSARVLQNETDNHLLQTKPVILGKPVFADRFSAVTLK